MGMETLAERLQRTEFPIDGANTGAAPSTSGSGLPNGAAASSAEVRTDATPLTSQVRTGAGSSASEVRTAAAAAPSSSEIRMATEDDMV